tara:strand:- start:343 stop:816 length:474 start_codon:yes stop_codon:yes gene_type:complete
MSLKDKYNKARLILGIGKKHIDLLNRLYAEYNKHNLENKNHIECLEILEEGNYLAEHMDYKDYLKSDYWVEFKKNMLKMHPNCSCCSKNPSTVLHHKHYKTKFREKYNEDVIAVCNECHSNLHHDKNMHRFYHIVDYSSKKIGLDSITKQSLLSQKD